MASKIVGLENPPVEETPKRLIHDHFDGAAKCVDCGGEECQQKGLDLFLTQLVTDIFEETAWIALHSSTVLQGGGIRFEIGPLTGKRIGSLIGKEQFSEFAQRALTTSSDKYPAPEPAPPTTDELLNVEPDPETDEDETKVEEAPADESSI